MKLKTITLCLIALVVLASAPNSNAQSGRIGNGEGDNRIIENATRIKLIVGETIIPAVLNDSKPAQALIAKLPYTVQLSRYEHDYCGVMSEPLPYDDAELRSGWKNGDIAFAVSGNYFAILYKDEDISQQFDGMVTMGGLGCDPAIMGTLDGSIAVRIERD
ncbi:cyclophilin-like fold protein [Pseudodesulfovibrio thermohalotolerans]|uniref:cyclophilin-like fold protein n=1 Tax=Pseudodesulfovibrio thermohalotolerans TaxID=2880651 RepID=UPI00244307A3|nr:cyclophilin-like fold protein [Pseudodesulfovibrio thermohalotolerans]WFS61919.1 cyclophilin-like fold protein [Pseudodesulfovibrio thermohalotolerans]